MNMCLGLGEMRRMVLNTKQSGPQSIKKDQNSKQNQRHQEGLQKSLHQIRIENSAAFNADLERLIKRKSVQKAENLLLKTLSDFQRGIDRKVRPDCFHFAIVIKGWGRSNCADKAEKLMNKMIHLHKNGNPPCPWLKPNKVVYSSVVNCWAMSKSKGSALRAEKLLKQMTLSTGVQPNYVTYSTVIKAWAKEGCAERAEELLREMDNLFSNGNRRVKPNTVTYNLVIEAFAKSNENGSADKAEKLLKRMTILYEKGDSSVKPDIKSYSNVIDAYAASDEVGSPQKAESILRLIELLFLRGDKELKPSVITYGTVIKAWTRHNNPQRAEGILKRMEMAMVQPNSVCFYMVIAAWARTSEQGSVEKVESLLNRMHAIQESENQREIVINPGAKIYTAVIDTYVNSQDPTAPHRAEDLLRFMVKGYDEGNIALKPTIGK